MRRWILRQQRFAPLLLLAYTALLAYLSLGRSYPAFVDRMFTATGSRIFHFGGYFGLAVLMGWALWGRISQAPLLALVFAFFYGLSLEGVQHFIPGRGLCGVDLLLNFSGAGIGAMFVRGWLGSRQEA